MAKGGSGESKYLRWLQPVYNTPRVEPRPVQEQAAHPSTVWVALSGGGTRAAALAWKVLEALGEVVFPDPRGKRSNLAEQIDYFSGISGGSFAAAAWCLRQPIREEFRERFLQRNVQRLLLGRAVYPPRNLLRLLTPYYNRIHVAADFYDTEVFGHKRFQDLPARPELRIHATNLALGGRFSFVQPDFDLLGSNLGDAFPVMLSPMTLKNYGDPLSEAELEERDPVYVQAKDNAPHDLEWYYTLVGREFYNNKANNRYIHLADGGLVDNQGLQAILDEFDRNGVLHWRLNQPDPPLQRLVIINVNAGTRPDNQAGMKVRAPGLRHVVVHTMVTSMDILSAKRWVRIQQHCGDLRRGRNAAARRDPAAPLAQLKTYEVEISFRQVEDSQDRRACFHLPTSFHLSEKQLALIDRVVPDLVRHNPDLQRLRTDLAEEGFA